MKTITFRTLLSIPFFKKKYHQFSVYTPSPLLYSMILLLSDSLRLHSYQQVPPMCIIQPRQDIIFFSQKIENCSIAKDLKILYEFFMSGVTGVPL